LKVPVVNCVIDIPLVPATVTVCVVVGLLPVNIICPGDAPVPKE